MVTTTCNSKSPTYNLQDFPNNIVDLSLLIAEELELSLHFESLRLMGIVITDRNWAQPFLDGSKLGLLTFVDALHQIFDTEKTAFLAQMLFNESVGVQEGFAFVIGLLLFYSKIGFLVQKVLYCFEGWKPPEAEWGCELQFLQVFLCVREKDQRRFLLLKFEIM